MVVIDFLKKKKEKKCNWKKVLWYRKTTHFLGVRVGPL